VARTVARKANGAEMEPIHITKVVGDLGDRTELRILAWVVKGARANPEKENPGGMVSDWSRGST